MNKHDIDPLDTAFNHLIGWSFTACIVFSIIAAVILCVM